MTRPGPRSVVGAYPDVHGAETAITTLQAHGFGGDDVHRFAGVKLDEAVDARRGGRDARRTALTEPRRFSGRR